MRGGLGGLFGTRGDGVAPAGQGPRLSQRLGYRLQNSRFASSPGQGQTISTLFHLPFEPVWVRLLYVNDQPHPWAVDRAALAPSAAFGDGVTATDGPGRADPGLWAAVSFSGGGNDTEPAFDPPPPVPGLTLPGNPRESGRPVHRWSDWRPVTALPRRDGGEGTFLLVRSFSRGLQRFAAAVGGPDRAIGREHAGFVADGDAADGAAAAFIRNDALFSCHGVQAIATMPGATVLGVGDSIIHSSCTTGEMSGFGVRACATLSTPRRPVSYLNEGFPGRDTLGSCTNGLWAVEAFRPQVAIIQAWSRNEPAMAATAERAFGRALAVAEATRRHGGVPVLTTAAPSFGKPGEEAGEAVRRASNERVRALGRQGWLVLDIDRLWGMSDPTRYRPGYDAGDGWHPNDRACADAAAALVPMLAPLLGPG